MLKRFLIFALVCACLHLSPPSYSQSTDTIHLLKGLALPLPPDYTETIVAPNPVEAALVTGKWKEPKLHNPVSFYGGTQNGWREITAKNDGWFDDSVLNGCYLYMKINAEKPAVMILSAMGDEMVYVNGEQRSGNPYGLKDLWESWEPHFDYSLLPIGLVKGSNNFLFRCTRGRMKVSLFSSRKPIMFNPKDVTLPDVLLEKRIDSWAAIVVVNSTPGLLHNLSIETSVEGGEKIETEVPVIQPMSVRKIPFRLIGEPRTSRGIVELHLSLLNHRHGRIDVLDTATIPVRIVAATENHKETFTSGIDGSVQYYAVNPSTDTARSKHQALFLSLHGASVEAINQSGSYESKPWGYIIAPTNRRPYGFNWEEWGMMDALEVLDIVKREFSIDESKIFLTGHSMGGHGVWHIGSLYPDQFAAIGPSAGWISFWTYRFKGMNLLDTSDVRKMIRRSTTPSETFLHTANYKQLGIYILHGSTDDNVPPEESRSMADSLRPIHHDFVYHEEPGAGHWWDKSDEPGVDCVDWPPMFDFFARHARPQKDQVREIDFSTSNPGVSSTDYWLRIDAQQKQLKMSSVHIRFDPGLRRFTGTTRNVKRLAIDLSILPSSDTVSVDLDSEKVTFIPHFPYGEQLWLERDKKGWSTRNAPLPLEKNALRYGTFKEVFRNKVIFVFGTHGKSDENRWAFNKARYDAEKLWYQGNGSVEVVADEMFNAGKYAGRNIVLYGNRTTNSAWEKLLADSPVQVGRGVVVVGKKRFSGDDLCCLFIRPIENNPGTSVAVIAGTGIAGMKVNNRLPYLSPGIGLPDCTVLSSGVLTGGDAGVLITGFFGLDWSVEHGEFVGETR
jgi:pimeloyl-ACP methyl ester carboxylesterase